MPKPRYEAVKRCSRCLWCIIKSFGTCSGERANSSMSHIRVFSNVVKEVGGGRGEWRSSEEEMCEIFIKIKFTWERD